MHNLSRILLRWSTAWSLLAATTVYALFLATVMPAQSAASRVYAGNWGAPDRQFHYTADEFYAAVSIWGDAGRAGYIEFRLGLDIVWALAYTAFLVFAIGLAAKRAFDVSDRRRLLILVPLVTLLLDYGENALGIFLVGQYPVRHDAIAALAALVTAGKWSTLVLSHVVLVIVLALALRRRVR